MYPQRFRILDAPTSLSLFAETIGLRCNERWALVRQFYNYPAKQEIVGDNAVMRGDEKWAWLSLEFDYADDINLSGEDGDGKTHSSLTVLANMIDREKVCWLTLELSVKIPTIISFEQFLELLLFEENRRYLTGMIADDHYLAAGLWHCGVDRMFGLTRDLKFVCRLATQEEKFQYPQLTDAVDVRYERNLSTC